MEVHLIELRQSVQGVAEGSPNTYLVPVNIAPDVKAMVSGARAALKTQG